MAEYPIKNIDIMGTQTKQFERKPEKYIFQIIQLIDIECPDTKNIAAF